MSVLIRGMVMPKSCMACPLYYYDQDSEHDVTRRCTVLDHAEIFPSYMERRDDCPLVEVPSADVTELKNGKWVNGKCSECSGAAPFWPMATTYYRSNFCQNCGARMDGGT